MSIFKQNLISENQLLYKSGDTGISLTLKREDLLDTEVSGNKFRKLKYNLLSAEATKKDKLLTYGGAFSNHIAATAKAGNLMGMQTIGIIRGEELGFDLKKTLQQNATLRFATNEGMQLKFIPRSIYKEKTTANFRESILKEFTGYYELPEGGTNELAIEGCKEILSSGDEKFDFICCSAGTGGTAAGIIEASENHQHTLVFSALKGDFLSEEIAQYTRKKNWTLITSYHFGGYAKVSEKLVEFINTFKLKYQIQLDPIYTGKMLFGLEEMMKNGYFSKNTRILAVHTGGLQGIAGVNARLKKQNIPLIAYDD
ncbi:MAG: pyridoxal-phosphate dependent enzyme [Leeuwenhoekiella sp.]